MIEIRKLAPVEMNIVHELAHEIWPESYKDIISTEQINYMLDWMYDVNTLTEQALTGHLFYLISEYGQRKGFIALEPNYPVENTLRVHKLYVLPESQGKGFGRKLLNQAIDVCFDLDMYTLNLNVNKANKAVDVYKHIGFEVVREEVLKIGKGFEMDDFVMELKIR